MSEELVVIKVKSARSEARGSLDLPYDYWVCATNGSYYRVITRKDVLPSMMVLRHSREWRCYGHPTRPLYTIDGEEPHNA